MSIFFSIITSTHNRKYELGKLINSLKSQKYKNFEWIVGDDGSIDGTEDFIKSKIKNIDFKVSYIKSSHRIGLSKMINTLMKQVKGQTFFICDSDDYLKPNSLEKIHDLFKRFSKNERKDLVGILSANVDEQNNNQLFYKDKIPKKDLFLQWRNIHDIAYGDGTLFAYSHYFKKLKLLEVDFYIPMSILFKKFEKKKLYVTNQIFKVMKRDASNSISFQKKMAYNRGNAYAISICENGSFFRNRIFLKKIRILLNYFRYCFHGDIKLSKAMVLWPYLKKNRFLIILYFFSLPLVMFDILFKKIEKTHLEFKKNSKITKITNFFF